EVWVLEISGAVPASHFEGGWSSAEGYRQPAMYFPGGGSTVRGISKPGEIVWSRIFVEDDQLNIDLGRATVVELPPEETQRRWQSTTPQWPIMHAVLHGVSRNQMMARHKANHIQVAYADSAADADRALLTKAVMAEQLGMRVSFCGVGGR
ncbi:MAG: fucose isomerase, partial [Planctomycetota bacterium]